MGAADIVPGVSGGTVALILGHYQRLITAISHIDSTFIKLLRQRRLLDAVQHADLRFLVGIAIGMASGIVALASLMHVLLQDYRTYTYAVFTGLILASSFLVGRSLDYRRLSTSLWLLAGAVFAWQLCMQTAFSADLTPLRAFLCAAVAICAMILPGISGAFVLLLLGAYEPITDLIKGLPKGEISLDGTTIIAAFIAGCLVGLLAFSRILRWLLANKHQQTMGFLVGLMLGSLYKLWPFQSVTPETALLDLKKQQFVYQWPGEHGDSIVIVIALVAVAAAATLALERIGTMFRVESLQQGNSHTS